MITECMPLFATNKTYFILQWLMISLRLRLDVNDTAMGIMWDIIGLVGVGAGVVVGIGYTFNMITAADALAVIGIVGGS